MGKSSIKKSKTIIFSPVGPSSAISDLPIITVGGSRTPGGNANTILDNQDTGTIGNIGNILKYVNVTIQAGPRDETPEDDTSGWIEWGFVKYKENFIAPTTSNLGTTTLMSTLTQAFRGDCLLTGCFAIGGDQPAVQVISLKIPEIFQKMQMGSELHLFMHSRSVNNASVSTTLHALIATTQYKLYV